MKGSFIKMGSRSVPIKEILLFDDGTLAFLIRGGGCLGW